MAVTDGDFNVAKLAQCVNSAERNAAAIDAWCQHAHAQGRLSTLVFAVDVKHAQVPHQHGQPQSIRWSRI